MGKKTAGFRGLTVWQKSYDLTFGIYKATKNFPKEEVYGLTSQIRRAAISIPANIAEGYERNHRKEYMQFLFISKGSLGELETHLQLAKDLGYLSDNEYAAIEEKRGEVARILIGLIKSLA